MAKTNVEQWVEAQKSILKTHSELQYHKFGNKSGKLLARLCKGAHVHIHITSLKDTQGILCSSPTDISSILEQYYNTLYSPDPSDLNATQEFLKKVPLPHIDPTQLLNHRTGNSKNNFLLCQWESPRPRWVHTWVFQTYVPHSCSHLGKGLPVHPPRWALPTVHLPSPHQVDSQKRIKSFRTQLLQAHITTESRL